MPKRKRSDEIEDQIAAIPDQALRIRVSRLKARFEHGVSQLTAQLRLARGFDRQKMTRRVKQAGDDTAKVARLNAEIQVLKDIKEPKVARQYLLKQCVRTKRIAESEAFVALFGENAGEKAKGKGTSVAEGNVLGRLFKVEAVSKVLPEIMKGIREAVGVDKAVEAKALNSEINGSVKIKSTTAEDDFAGFSDQSDEVMAEGGVSLQNEDADPSDKVDDEFMASYNDRLAASSDDEDGDENQSDLNHPIKGQNHNRLNDMEITTDEEAEADSDIVPDISSDENEQTNSTTKPPATSFLPILMHGGYYSGSDSDSEDPQTYDNDPSLTSKPERKNRRGQKARQAIAEKRYGTKARHLIKQEGAEGVHGDRQRLIQGTSTSRNDGWDMRRGAVGSVPRKPARAEGKERAPNRFERRNGYAKPRHGAVKKVRTAPRPVTSSEGAKVAKPAVKAEKLHPSWEAARKKKLESAGAGAGSFAGKKITFD